MAKRFHFNLEVVLRYRQIQEDEAKRVYLDLKRQIEQERVKQEEMDAERGSIQDEIVQAFADHAPIQSITVSYHMIGRLDNAMAESRRRQQQLETMAEQKRLAMIEATQKRKVMETLKDRRREEYNHEQDMIEQALLDEMAIQSQGRRVRAAKAELEFETQEQERLLGLEQGELSSEEISKILDEM